MFIEEVASVMGLERQTGFMRKYEKSLSWEVRSTRQKRQSGEDGWGHVLSPNPEY